MTKQAFIESVEYLYDTRRRVAKNAEFLIADMLREVGDMPMDYLYDNIDDPDWCWLDNDRVLVGLYLNKDIVHIQMADASDYTKEFTFQSIEVSTDDLIEIADYLCRR